MTLSEFFDVAAARSAGFFDEVVDPANLIPCAEARAESLHTLDQRAHSASKRRIRAALIRRIRYSVPLDLLDAAMMGLRGARLRQR